MADHTELLARLGVPEREVFAVEDAEEGVIVTTTDGQRYVEVPADRPDLDGKTGLMFLRPPTPTYNGTFPVYAHEQTPPQPEVVELDAVGITAGDEVPDGNAAEIEDWVGDDPARAAAALAAENGRDKPRRGLVTFLERVVGA